MSNQDHNKEIAWDHLTEEQKWERLTRVEKLGEVLLKQGKLTLQQLESLIKEQENSEIPLGELILNKGMMSRHELLGALDQQHKTDQAIIDSLTEMMPKSEE